MNMIFREQLLQMKKDALTINNSHGGIINEDCLYKVIIEGHLGEVAIDVSKMNPTLVGLSK